jgi:hypothetical protein
MHDQPTKDYLRWDGVLYEPPEKQNPVPMNGTGCPNGSYIPVSQPLGQLDAVVSQPIGNVSEVACPNGSYISRLTTWGVDLPEGYQALAPCDEADSPAWVDAWLEQAMPTLSLAEIRQSMGYRQ